MNRKFFIASAVAAVSIASAASADLVAFWDMTAIQTGTTGTTYSIGAANAGAQTAGSEIRGVHAVAATTWSSPAGNGSANSFSSNNWTTGDYYEIKVSTINYAGISISLDSTRSGTGPATFKLSVSTDGGATFTTLVSSYSVLTNGASPNASWTTGGVRQLAYNLTTAAGAADNAALAIFRFESLATTAAGGTMRIDNVEITGNLVPAPGALALLGAAGMLGLRRRRA